MTPPRDAHLLRRYVTEGDQSSFAQLVARHIDWVYSAALRTTRDATLAEDVTQGVFLALAQKAARLCTHPNLAGWLFQATQFAAGTALRSERRRKIHENRAMQQKVTTSATEQVDRYWGQIRDRVEDAVGHLRGKDRELILLRFYRGLTLAEVGGVLGIEEEAARKRVTRALDRLRERLSGDGDAAPTLSAALIAHAVIKAPPALTAAVLSPVHGAGALAAAQAVKATLAWAKFKAAAVVLAVVSVIGVITGGTIVHLARGATPSPTAAANFSVTATGPAAASAGPIVYQLQRTGRFQLTFTERSPHSPFEELTRHGQYKFTRPYDRASASPQFLAEDEKNRANAQYDIANESFEVFVPPAYKPSVPFGLFVWISAGAAELPPGWDEVLIRHKLIWISANNTGNARSMFIRSGLALDAVHNMKQRYNLDPDRIYVSGFSGGGGVATDLMTGFADVFRGVMPMCGGGFIGGRVTKDRKFEAGAGYTRIDGDQTWVKKNIKIVQIEGAVDPGVWPPADRVTVDAMLLEGFERYTGIVVPRMGHAIPSALWFDNGIKALESKPKILPTTAPTPDPHPGPGQIGQAKRFLVEGETMIDGKWPNKKLARKYLQRVIDDYPTTPSAAKARQLLDQLDHAPPATTRGSSTRPR